ncbi:MAG TPA: hypothetical protein VLO07_04600 [Thermoanaerobaculia bacterium]|nr:hypothetical protein [Thermoanaerobaculia bacterium]
MRRSLCLLLFLSAPALVAASFEKSIPVPRIGEARLGWTSAGCAVLSVSLQNYPSLEDIENARRKDLNDKSWVWWNFHVENRGQAKCRIKLWVDVYDRAGHVAKSSDRTDTVEAGKLDDNIRVSTRMRTLDIADSPRAHVRAEIGPK